MVISEGEILNNETSILHFMRRLIISMVGDSSINHSVTGPPWNRDNMYLISPL